MQATDSKRQFGFGRLSGSAVAVGIVAAFAVGIVAGIVGQAVLDDTTSSTGGSLAIVQPMAYPSAGQGEGLVGANFASESNGSSDYQFMEQNMYLPGGTLRPAVTSSDTMSYLELNLNLPGSVAADLAHWQLIEQNSWGEGFAFTTPHPHDHIVDR